MSGTSRPLLVWRRGRCLTAIVLALPMALMSGACNSSGEARVDRTLLTRAAASLALSVGEVVERYAAELPTADDEQMDIERLRSIFADSADALDFDAAGSSFATAASASRKSGNGKVETARQLQAAARLASEAFRPPLPDYKPGDQAMLAAIASRLEPELNAALTSTYNLETGDVKITHLDSILADAVQFVVMVAGYNYADHNGSHTIRDRMQRLGMRPPPAEFIDAGGNLRLPHGSEPDDQIARFEDWRIPADDSVHNRLFDAADFAIKGRTHEAIEKVFEEAADKTFG